MVESKITEVKDRKDIKLFRAILNDGSSIDIEAKDKDEATAKIEEWFESLPEGFGINAPSLGEQTEEES